jgi:PIN domain nuclease of toxin-antitoxin system
MIKRNNKTLLDASAIIALIKQEDGYQEVDKVLATSAMSTVNLAELVTTLAKDNIEAEDIDTITTNLVPEIIPFSYEIATLAGKLYPQTKHIGLSLGDRACLATALHLGLPVYTADKVWKELNIANLEIHLIR